MATPAQSYLEQFGKIPKRILMLKGHSAGIGDILRSSAAWRALKDTFPGCELHLALFTWEPGYASAALIARHHLLNGFEIVDKNICRLQGWPRLCAWADAKARQVSPDLVLDFEPAGIYSSLAAWRVGRECGAVTGGIGEFPARGAFYDLVSVPKAEFARRRGLEYPLEYSCRDFVCLSALQIERNGLPIELEETEEGRLFRESLRDRFRLPTDTMIIGLNIGCGTSDAVRKRPDLKLLFGVVEKLQQAHEAVVVLAGAKFEKDINQDFLSLWPDSRKPLLFDLAGLTSLLELSGLIRACDLFVSTDSGPYHMAVALGVPTLAVFKGLNRVHTHREKHAQCVDLTKEEHVAPAIQVGEELLARRGKSKPQNSTQ